MSRIEPVDYSGAEGRPKELLDAVNGLLGATPNMTTTMARSAVLDGWLGLSGALRKGSISAANGERIALGVAEANECAYCLSVHSYLGANVVKLDPEELEQAPASSHQTPRRRRSSRSPRRSSARRAASATATSRRRARTA
jgi:AhpD family alkylhydroperoxidase